MYNSSCGFSPAAEAQQWDSVDTDSDLSSLGSYRARIVHSALTHKANRCNNRPNRL